ncbi:DNA polymerase elongation subunit [Methanosarcinales archaeon]|nr:MAG: DNA polymerase elongation subunit [Methanosarcinales archaeon]
MVKFQILDADYTYDKNKKPLLRFYGRDHEGQSVCCFVPGFKPYFYLQTTTSDIENVLRSKFSQILSVEEVHRFPAVGYYKNPVLMHRVVVSDPKDVREIRDEVAKFGKVFETDILFRNRFMIDHDIGGMSWVSVEEMDGKVSGADEVNCDLRLIGKMVPVEQVSNAKLRFLAFDIECPTAGGMPDATRSPIVLISMYFKPSYNEKESIVLSAKPVAGLDAVEGCDSEISLLKRFFEIVKDFDPDVILGYNSNGFDFPYIVDRIKHLDAGIKSDIGRDGKPVYYRRIGTTTHVTVTGRIIVDILPIIRKEFSLKQYTLKNSAKELLGLEKHDVRVEDMQNYWNSENLLPTFIEYCRNDSYLAMEMMMRYRLLDKYIALARVSGSLLQDILDSGQTAMVENLLLKEYRTNQRVMPPKPDEKSSSYRHRAGEELKGGEVLQPSRGLSEDIVILDYRSLYPSIMMAHNLCYTTEIIKDVPDSSEDIITTPSNARFVSKKIQQGILPKVLEQLLKLRVKIKEEMKQAGEDEIHALDATQLALKILLNSFYGYSGYARARLYSLNLANSVTSYGRENILYTKQLIEKDIKNTILTDSDDISSFEVVYGDTDSVFVKINSDKKLTIDEVSQIGTKIADAVTSHLEKPMELVFEAVARRGVFLAKKRYAIWVFEKRGDRWEDKIKVKGMETVRRDWCELASNTLNDVLELVLKKGSIDEAAETVRDAINTIRTLDISQSPDDLSKLILTRRYTKKTETYRNKQPHITVVEKIKKRNGTVPNIGDRIPFVIIAGSGLLVTRAEQPEYVIANNLPIDTNYYINKQILPPVERIFKSLGISTKHLDSRSLATNNETKSSQRSLFDF